MNNKCNQGCGAGFVPVNGNWDFNMDGCCQRQRQNRCNACETAETNSKRGCQTEYVQSGDCQKNTCTGRADCPCERCARRREAEYKAYASCQKNTCTGRADCTCEQCSRDRREAENNACSGQKHKADNRGVGIVWTKMQEIDDIYDCGRALKAGTLYPELHKPLSGYWPCDEGCGDKCQQIAFALWELRLYLNTHPYDKEALARFRRLQEDCCEPGYATTFLPEGCARWFWTDDPWPWEYSGNKHHDDSQCCE